MPFIPDDAEAVADDRSTKAGLDLYRSNQQDNLPANVSGQIPQAMARKSARRGGTPNAPEVDDEPAPAATGPTGVSGGPPPQSIAMPGAGYVADSLDQIRQAYRTGGVGAAIGQTGRSAAGYPIAYAADALQGVRPAWDAAAQGLKTFVTGDPTPIGAPSAKPAPAATAAPAGGWVSGNELPTGTPPRPAPPPVAAPAPVPQATTLPAGITRVGNSYTGVGEAPSGAPVGTDLNPSPYAQQLAAYNARDRADLQSRNQAMAAQANWAGAWTDRRDAESAARVARFNALNSADIVLRGSPPTSNLPAQYESAARLAEARAAGARMELTKASEQMPLAGARNQIGEASIEGETRNRNILATTTAQQAPLHAELTRQQIAIGKSKVTAEKSRQAIVDELADPKTTPERHAQLVNSLYALEGKPPVEPYQMNVTPGRFDVMGNWLPGETTVMHKMTGQVQHIAGEATMKPAGQGATFGQYKEGDELIGKDGKRYVVQNGQPVLK